jgi:two-component system, LytTR family, response regulator
LKPGDNDVEKIRALIVDDEPLAREGILIRLEQAPDVEVIGECGNGQEAVTAIRREAPDLVFLDIQMPRLDGFGVIEAVGVRQMPHVIFVTAYDEHALQAFEVSALDYLLKPIDGRRFFEALERARDRIRGKNLEAISAQLHKMMAALQAERKYLERLSIKSAGKSGGRITFLGVDEIDWIGAADNYVQVHAGRVSHLLHATMNSLENRLDPSKFLRIHRSTIVNVERIKELRPMFHGEYQVILKDGTQLTSGRGYRENLQRLLNNL